MRWLAAPTRSVNLKADAYLENREYQNAVNSYQKVINADSDDYVSHRKLAAAYAGVAGFNLMDVIAGSLSEIIAGSDGGSDVNEQITTLLRRSSNPPTQAQLDAFLNGCEYDKHDS